MAKINQALLDRLATKLGVSKPRVYALIQEISNTNRVRRHIGALLLAADNKISIGKYATTADHAELRGVSNHHIPVAVPSAEAASRSVVRNKAVKVPKIKENTVFVVHGRDTKL